MEVPCRSTLHLQLKAVDAVYSVLELLLQGGVAVRELLPHFEEDAFHHCGSEVRRLPQFYSCLPENVRRICIIGAAIGIADVEPRSGLSVEACVGIAPMP